MLMPPSVNILMMENWKTIGFEIGGKQTLSTTFGQYHRYTSGNYFCLEGNSSINQADKTDCYPFAYQVF